MKPQDATLGSPTADAPPSAPYAATARWLHWITALLMLVTIPIAWQMHAMARGAPLRGALFTTHKTIGVTILLLAAARLIWRSRRPAPPLPPTMPRWGTAIAKANHALLYVLLLGMPSSGYLESATGGHPVRYLGLFDLPMLAHDDAVSHLMLSLHRAGQWLLYAAILLHLLGTAWHVAILRDGTLARMLPPRRSLS